MEPLHLEAMNRFRVDHFSALEDGLVFFPEVYLRV